MYKQHGRRVQESKKLFEEMRMKAQGTPMPLSRNPLTPSPYFHSHILVVQTTLSLSLQLASSLGLICLICWDANWIEHQRQLVVPLLCCPEQRMKLVMKLHILNSSHFPSRSTSKNVFLGFEKWCRRWVVVGLDLKSVCGSNDFLFGC